MSMKQIRESRGVPAKRGMRVYFEHGNRFGRIVSAKGGYLKILLDGDKHPGFYHPTWKIDYLQKNTEVKRKLFVCKGCEGVYAEEPVSECDCQLTPPTFAETSFSYLKVNQ